jgi:hypothetical protein
MQFHVLLLCDICHAINDVVIGFRFRFAESPHVYRLAESMAPDCDSDRFHVWEFDTDPTSQCFDVLVSRLTQSDSGKEGRVWRIPSLPHRSCQHHDGV